MLKSLLSTRTRIIALVAMIMIFTSLGGLVSAQYAGKEFRGWFFNMKKLSSAEIPTNAQIASAPGYVAFYLDSSGVPKFKTSAGVVTTITTGGSSGLTANTFIVAGTAGAITSKSAATNGQILIGSTGLVPALAALTGTANQVTVTNGAGSITLSTPQSIATTSDVTFNSVTTTLGLQSSAVARTATADGLTTGTVADRTSFVAVTSASVDNIIVLPTPTPGITVRLAVAATGYELRSSAPASIAINGGTGADAESAIAANVLTTCTCTSATTWICMDQASNGAIAASQVAAP